MMKRNTILAGALCAAALVGQLAPLASAATLSDATIDHSRKASLSITKYDITSAREAGVDTSGLISTGRDNATAEKLLGDYTLGGVEFTYLKLGDVDMHTNSNATNPTIQVIYGIQSQEVRNILGLTTTAAIKTEGGIPWYDSDTISKALQGKLQSNTRATKDALEAVVEQGGTAMPLTDDVTGTTGATNLPVGLYLVVETEVPENVNSTTDPFLVSLPMTDVTDADEWLYDVSVYPKNETNNPTLEKEVSDLAHGVSFTGDIHNKGYMDVATGSTGDTMGYRFISTLPTISSQATYLTTYRFDDTLSKGLEYNKYDVKVCWYSSYDAAVADYTLATATKGATAGAKAQETWTCDASGKGTYFNVSYGAAQGDGSTSMAVVFSQAGLNRINAPAQAADQRGRMSDWTCVVYYTAKLNSSADVSLGDNANPNHVELTWERTSEGYMDTLEDDAQVYSYGIHIAKKFAGGTGDHSKVQFVARNLTNATGAYYIVAQKAADGTYWATGTTTDEAKATRMSPSSTGNLYIYGLEEDTYSLTEVQTAPGFTLLEDEIVVNFDTKYTAAPGMGSLTATATVDGSKVTLTPVNGSNSGQAPLTVVNHKGFELPETGGNGTMLMTVGGVVAAGGLFTAAAVVLLKRKDEAAD